MGDPADAGFAMPPEWAPHESTWLAWPVAEETWVAGLEPAEDAYLEMIEAIAPGERVELLAPPAELEDVRERLQTTGLDVLEAEQDAPAPGAGTVRVHGVDYVDSWLRDTGPTVLTRPDGERLAVDWRFDAWGKTYEALTADDALAAEIAERAGLERFRVNTVLEGGAFDVDGDGRVLATESCLLDPDRGPDRSSKRLEALLGAHLGADTVVWLDGSLRGDDTDGHVDTLARFSGPGAVLALEDPGPGHPDHEVLAENLERLEAAGPGLEVDLLPVPEPIDHGGRPLPASYANFYVSNAAVLVPTFDDPADEAALATIDGAFERPAFPIDARALIVGYGACHCLTQQIPAADASS